MALASLVYTLCFLTRHARIHGDPARVIAEYVDAHNKVISRLHKLLWCTWKQYKYLELLVSHPPETREHFDAALRRLSSVYSLLMARLSIAFDERHFDDDDDDNNDGEAAHPTIKESHDPNGLRVIAQPWHVYDFDEHDGDCDSFVAIFGEAYDEDAYHFINGTLDDGPFGDCIAFTNQSIMTYTNVIEISREDHRVVQVQDGHVNARVFREFFELFQKVVKAKHGTFCTFPVGGVQPQPADD